MAFFEQPAGGNSARNSALRLEMKITMTYKEKIHQLFLKIPQDIIPDFNQPRGRNRLPTQAFSEFLTNREQGDWAEKLILNAINKTNKDFVAVQYGKSDRLVAGEAGFKEFYEAYQDELDHIGKRPDILVFRVKDYKSTWNFSISHLAEEEQKFIVPKAIAGLEIRSSSFLAEKYDRYFQQERDNSVSRILVIQQDVLEHYEDVLDENWRKIIENISTENLGQVTFNLPRWRKIPRQMELKEKLQELKELLRITQKRDFLSVTSKIEDLLVVYKWVQTFNVPHFYFQVFFDKVYGIAFENILELIGDSANRDSKFFIEQDEKNQQKTTIKINVKEGIEIAGKVAMPNHHSDFRELDRGRLLFFIKFEGGEAYLNTKNLFKLLNLSSGD